jgi:hypothetical protein
MQPSHCKEMVHGEPSEPSCTCSKRTTKHCPCTPAQLAVPDRAGFIPSAVRNGRVLKLSRTLSGITAPPSMRSRSVLPPFHAPEAYAHVSGLCGAARFLAEMRRYRTLCVLLRLPKKSFGPPCENAFPGAVLLPAPESLFYMLSTGLRHSFNNILYISALQTTMSCGIVHHAAQEAVVATADMHQRRRLSHCTQKTATRKAGGQGAGDNHQGERNEDYQAQRI